MMLNKTLTLAKIAEVALCCRNFFDWDWCQDNCPMYKFCDDLETIFNLSLLEPKKLTQKVKEALKQLPGKWDIEEEIPLEQET